MLFAPIEAFGHAAPAIVIFNPPQMACNLPNSDYRCQYQNRSQLATASG
jgi:hypothetical protein